VIKVYHHAHVDGGHGTLAVHMTPDPATDPYAGANFVTDPRDPLQVGQVRYRGGHRVPPHTHTILDRASRCRTAEVLFVRSGRVEVELASCPLNPKPPPDLATALFTAGPGDVVVLMNGGHSLKALEDTDLVEVKSGPYAGSREKDKRDL